MKSQKSSPLVQISMAITTGALALSGVVFLALLLDTSWLGFLEKIMTPSQVAITYLMLLVIFLCLSNLHSWISEKMTGGADRLRRGRDEE